MKIIPILILMLFPSVAFAIGGVGSTCDPSTPNWGSCSLAPVPFAASVTNTINVDGGNWATPYQANQANTRYVLQGDVVADSTAFIVTNNYIIIDLNGHTITYNKVSPGSGVNTGAYSKHHIAIRNGSIIQSTESLGKIFSVSVYNGGTGYTLGDVLTLDGPTDATVTVTGESGGVITGVSITTPGLGFAQTWYKDGKLLSGFDGVVTGGTGNGALINVSRTVTEGDQYGYGNNPVSNFSTELLAMRSAANMHVSNIYVRYSGRDVGGIVGSGSDGIYEQNTIEDTYEFGTIKNRQAGVKALTGQAAGGTSAVLRYNTIINARQSGIACGEGAEAYGNHVTIRSICTNSIGISPKYQENNISIHDNTIVGTGEHPVGLAAGGGTGNRNISFVDNVINVQITALGVEYGSSWENDPTATYTGNAASGIRLTWDAYDIYASGNQITVVTDDRYTGTYSPTGGVAYINGQGKGLFIGGDVAGSRHVFVNNVITVTGDSNYTTGILCAYSSSDSLFVLNNTVTSSGYNIVFGDSYGRCNGYPLFSGNTLIKSGTSTDYRTYANLYNSTDRNAEVRIVDSIYQGGAAEDSYTLQPQGGGITDIYFGTATADNYVYSYRLHDANNTSSTLLTETFDPPISLLYANPGDLPPEPMCDSDHPSLCLTQETCEGASLYWYNDMCNAAPYVPPACGYDHPELCMTQGNCEAVSGLSWCDNACQVGACGGEPPPVGSARRLSLGGSLIKLAEPGP